MRELVLLKIGEVVTNQPRAKPIAFAFYFELHQQTFSDITCPTTYRVKVHDCPPGLLNNLFGPTTHCRNFLIGSIEPAVRVEIPDYADGCVAYLPFNRTHVKLPLE